MRFKQFILEDLPKKPSSQPIEMTKALEWARRFAPHVMERARSGKLSLYRGVEGTSGAFQLGDSTTFKRVSKNTHNYYTKFISTSPKWSAYPSRESAYICATNDRIASGYGDLFFVLPADDAKVGKCDAHDIWRSFPELEEALGLPGLNSLNHYLIALMKALDGEITPDTDAEEIRKTLRGWTLKRLYDLAETPKKLNHQIIQQLEVTVRTMAKKGLGTFEDLLEYCLDPEINNFTTSIAAKANVPSKPGVEAWIEGKALFIREDQFQDFLQQYFK